MTEAEADVLDPRESYTCATHCTRKAFDRRPAGSMDDPHGACDLTCTLMKEAAGELGDMNP